MGTTNVFGGLNQQTTQAAVLVALQSLVAGQQTGYAKDSSLATLHTDLQGVSTALGPLATQTTLAAVLAKLSGDPASQTTLAALLAKTTADPATNTTAAAILAKLSADPATKASVDAVTAALGSVATQTTLAAVLAKMPTSPALDASVTAIRTEIVSGQQHTDLVAIVSALGNLGTQTTASAILAKLPTSPALDATVAGVKSSVDSLVSKTSGDQATQTTLAALLGKTSADQATQTTLAAVLAKLTGDPSTGANQSLEIAALQALVSALGVGSNGLTKAEDSAVTSGDRGLATLVMRGLLTPTASTDAPGDYTMPLADAEGRQVMLFGAIPENTQQAAIALTTTTASAIFAAKAAGIRNYLKTLVINMGAATATVVTVLDGSTVIGRFSMTGAIGTTQELNFDPPLRGTPATAMNAQLSAASTVNITATGYVGV